MSRTILALLMTLLAACSTTPTTQPAAPTALPPAKLAAVPAPVIPAAKPVPVPEEAPLQAFERLRAAIAGRSVYFAFDKDSVPPAEEGVIGEHTRIATSYARDQVVLQGNCDERGGREYNLALGQKRAEAVKSRMELLGVQASRIETISFGKEKPRAPCHQESCWMQNRRVDFVDAWK